MFIEEEGDSISPKKKRLRFSKVKMGGRKGRAKETIDFKITLLRNPMMIHEENAKDFRGNTKQNAKNARVF